MGQAITTLFWRLLGRGEAGKSLQSADHRRDGDGDECTGSVWLFGRYWTMGEALIGFLRWLIGRAPATPPSDPVLCYPFDFTPEPPDDDVESGMVCSQYHHFIDIGIDSLDFETAIPGAADVAIGSGDADSTHRIGRWRPLPFGSPIREVSVRLVDVDVAQSDGIIATSPAPAPTVLVDGNQEEAPCRIGGGYFEFRSPVREVSIRLVDVDVAEAEGVIAKSLPPAATSPPPPMSSRRGRGSLGPYSWEQKILLVGEGDFSFSASLAVEFGDASNIISTSLDSFEFLMKNYERAVSNIFELTSKGCKVMHGVDATKMANKPQFSSLKFDRIVYNFPHAGFAYLKAPRDAQISKHQALVRGFLANAKKMIKDDGQIHITHKCVGFSRDWNLEMLGTTEGLRLVEEAPFNYRDYLGYNTKYGYGGDRNFNCRPSKRYKFQLVTSPPKNKRTRRKQKN